MCLPNWASSGGYCCKLQTPLFTNLDVGPNFGAIADTTLAFFLSPKIRFSKPLQSFLHNAWFNYPFQLQLMFFCTQMHLATESVFYGYELALLIFLWPYLALPFSAQYLSVSFVQLFSVTFRNLWPFSIKQNLNLTWLLNTSQWDKGRLIFILESNWLFNSLMIFWLESHIVNTGNLICSVLVHTVNYVFDPKSYNGAKPPQNLLCIWG